MFGGMWLTQDWPRKLAVASRWLGILLEFYLCLASKTGSANPATLAERALSLSELMWSAINVDLLNMLDGHA